MQRWAIADKLKQHGNFLFRHVRRIKTIFIGLSVVAFSGPFLFSQEPFSIPRQDTLPPSFYPDTTFRFQSDSMLNTGNNRAGADHQIRSVFHGDTLLRSPWGAVGRSLILPGWGQIYNDRPWKALLFMAGDVSAIYFYHQWNKTVRRIEQQRKTIDRQIRTDPYLSDEQKRILEQRFRNLTTRLDGALNRRNIYGWLFALSHLLCMVDAYVDAHLYGFDEKMEMAFCPENHGVLLLLRYSIR